jgi:hypothetical protein
LSISSWDGPRPTPTRAAGTVGPDLSQSTGRAAAVHRPPSPLPKWDSIAAALTIQWLPSCLGCVKGTDEEQRCRNRSNGRNYRLPPTTLGATNHRGHSTQGEQYRQIPKLVCRGKEPRTRRRSQAQQRMPHNQRVGKHLIRDRSYAALDQGNDEQDDCNGNGRPGGQDTQSDPESTWHHPNSQPRHQTANDPEPRCHQDSFPSSVHYLTW